MVRRRLREGRNSHIQLAARLTPAPESAVNLGAYSAVAIQLFLVMVKRFLPVIFRLKQFFFMESYPQILLPVCVEHYSY